MEWSEIFGFANGFALIWWIVLVAVPRSDKVARAVLFGGCGLLALAYAVLLIGLASGAISGGEGPPVDFTTLSGVRAIFMTDGGATVGWIHYLAFDLFAGLWIARNADANGIHRLIQLPVLILTFMAGPVGLLCYLALRGALAKDTARISAPH